MSIFFEHSVASQASIRERDRMVRELRSLKVCDDEVEECLRCGIAVFHAGFTTGERRLVEAGVQSGAIRVVCATTLAGDFGRPRSLFRDANSSGVLSAAAVSYL